MEEEDRRTVMLAWGRKDEDNSNRNAQHYSLCIAKRLTNLTEILIKISWVMTHHLNKKKHAPYTLNMKNDIWCTKYIIISYPRHEFWYLMEVSELCPWLWCIWLPITSFFNLSTIWRNFLHHITYLKFKLPDKWK